MDLRDNNSPTCRVIHWSLHLNIGLVTLRHHNDILHTETIPIIMLSQN